MVLGETIGFSKVLVSFQRKIWSVWGSLLVLWATLVFALEALTFWVCGHCLFSRVCLRSMWATPQRCCMQVYMCIQKRTLGIPSSGDLGTVRVRFRIFCILWNRIYEIYSFISWSYSQQIKTRMYYLCDWVHIMSDIVSCVNCYIIFASHDHVLCHVWKKQGRRYAGEP